VLEDGELVLLGMVGVLVLLEFEALLLELVGVPTM
jgi:hypothetical protein